MILNWRLTLSVNYKLNLANGDSQFHKIVESNLKFMYWSFKQQLVHHSVNGCNMRPGDLCGTGTISGSV